MKKVNIYTLSDPDTLEVRYIGKTVSKISYRLAAHISETKANKSKSYRNSWISGILKRGKKPIIELLETVDNSLWRDYERYWISQFKTWGFDLVNMTDGGDGATNQIRTQESINKFKKTISKMIASGEIDYSERAKKISKSSIGKKLSEETKLKLRNINLGKKYSDETKRKKSKGGVLQYDLNMNLVGEYKSLSHAQEETGFLRGNISSACTNRLKTYKKFIWRYKGKDIVDT